MEDAEIVKKILEGDLTLFEEIVNRYETQILVYTKRILNNNQQDAEDTTAETFFKCYKNLASYNSEYKFSSWLYRIAHNNAVNLIHSKSKLFYIDINDFWQIPTNTKEELPLTKNELDKILDKLRFDDKNVLVLFYLQEKSLREISDILKISENAVAKRLTRARDRARKLISPKLQGSNPP
jgi:RNA polymerase sigma factor (sigma-70 family)